MFLEKELFSIGEFTVPVFLLLLACAVLAIIVLVIAIIVVSSKWKKANKQLQATEKVEEKPAEPVQ